MQENLLHNGNTVLKKALDQYLSSQENVVKIQPIDEEQSIPVEDFKASYVEHKRPVVIRGGMQKSAAFKKWDFDFFEREKGGLDIVSNLYDVTNTHRCSMQDLIAAIRTGKSSYPVYLQEWWFQSDNQDMLSDVEVPEYFSDDQNNVVFGYMNHTLWIGQQGAFTPIHQDTVHANLWTAQLRGSKHWILIDPCAALYADDEGNCDFTSLLREQNHCVYQTTLNEGDILYMPHRWWHRAETLSNAISMNTFYITPEILQPYIRDVLSIPLAASLNQNLLKDQDPMRYNICMQRAEILAKNMGLDIQNILRIDTSGQAKNGIYTKQAGAGDA